MFLMPRKIVSFDKTSLEPRFFHINFGGGIPDALQRTTVFRPSAAVTLEIVFIEGGTKTALEEYIVNE